MDKEYERVFYLLDQMEELDFQEKTKKVSLGEKKFIIKLEKEIEQSDDRKSFSTTRIVIKQEDGKITAVSEKKSEQDINRDNKTSSYFVREFMREYVVQTEKTETEIDGPYAIFTIISNQYCPTVRIYQTDNGLKAISADDYMFYKQENLMKGCVKGRKYAYDFLDETYTVDGIDYDTIKDGYIKIEEQLQSVNDIYKNILKKSINLVPLDIYKKVEKERTRLAYGMEKVCLAQKNIDKTIDKWTDFEAREVIDFEYRVIDMIADIKVENMAQDMTQKLRNLNECQREQVLSKIIIKK